MAGRHVTLRELALGFEGLALLRGLVDGSDVDQAARISDVVRIATEIEDEPWTLGVDVPEFDALQGYAQWSRTYDTQDNLLIDIEQPVVEAICADVPAGRALDAACGTGRHSKHLSARHDVTGIDLSPEMLALAVAAVPDARFHEGSLTAIPAEDASFDLVVCSLALTHLTDLQPVMAEFARVAKPGARIVLSDIHPTAVLVLGQGFYTNPDGSRGFVRNHVHLHSSYVDAFASAGLEIRRCVEPRLEGAQYGGPAALFIPDACIAAVEGLPMALVWELERS